MSLKPEQCTTREEYNLGPNIDQQKNSLDHQKVTWMNSDIVPRVLLCRSQFLVFRCGLLLLSKLISPWDESRCDVKHDNEDFRKRNEGIQEMFVITILCVHIHCRNQEYFSNDQQKGDYEEDMISESDPYGIFASDIVLTLCWRRRVIQVHSAKD